MGRRTVCRMQVSGIERHVSEHVKFLSERSKKTKKQKKNKEIIFFEESAKNSRNTQFGFVILMISVLGYSNLFSSLNWFWKKNVVFCNCKKLLVMVNLNFAFEHLAWKKSEALICLIQKIKRLKVDLIAFYKTKCNKKSLDKEQDHFVFWPNDLKSICL